MNRRALLLGSTAILAGCQQPPSNVNSWAQYASALFGGLATAVDQVAAIANLPLATATTIKQDLATISNIASVLAGVTDPNKALPLALQIEQVLNSVVAAAQPFAMVLSSPVGIAIAAAQVVLPLLETAINQALGVAKIAVKTSSPIVPMTPQAGLSYLQATAKK